MDQAAPCSASFPTLSPLQQDGPGIKAIFTGKIITALQNCHSTANDCGLYQFTGQIMTALLTTVVIVLKNISTMIMMAVFVMIVIIVIIAISKSCY